MKIAFFGSSLLSSYWNGAATYYRGIIKALHTRGHAVTFYEPDAYERQSHRDIQPPEWAESIVYSPSEDALGPLLKHARSADLIIKASGVGVLDGFLEAAVPALRTPENAVVFWDVDAPATLERVAGDPADPFRELIPRFDAILTYGGGEPVVTAYASLGARCCVPIYNGLDPETHHPAPADERFAADLAFLGNRLSDRESRVEEFFLRAAENVPESSFLLAGSGWEDKPAPPNVRRLGHVGTADHNAFNRSARLVLNVSRSSMARFGFSPATRVFEAAGAGACLVTDSWQGIGTFFEPGREILVADGAQDVADFVANTPQTEAVEIGRRARQRALGEHTYAHRADQFERVFAS